MDFTVSNKDLVYSILFWYVLRLSNPPPHPPTTEGLKFASSVWTCLLGISGCRL